MIPETFGRNRREQLEGMQGWQRDRPLESVSDGFRQRDAGLGTWKEKPAGAGWARTERAATQNAVFAKEGGSQRDGKWASSRPWPRGTKADQERAQWPPFKAGESRQAGGGNRGFLRGAQRIKWQRGRMQAGAQLASAWRHTGRPCLLSGVLPRASRSAQSGIACAGSGWVWRRLTRARVARMAGWTVESLEAPTRACARGGSHSPRKSQSPAGGHQEKSWLAKDPAAFQV